MNDIKDCYKERKYSVVPYESNWSVQFDNYFLKIKKIFGDVQVEHVGSTSVPGMSGKPCIDLLVLVSDLKYVDNNIKEMGKEGFEYAGEYVMKDSRLFRVSNNNTVLANVHFFPNNHPHVAEMINLRDYFRSHPEEVIVYSKIKDDLYIKYPNDYASYRKYKDEYMNSLKTRII